MKSVLIVCCVFTTLFLQAEEDSALFLESSLPVIRTAAELGDSDYQLLMGVLLQYGYGFSQNFEEAASWYLLSANQGNPSAQKNLGILSILGLGIPQDKVTGMAWIFMGSFTSASYLVEFEPIRREFLQVLTEDEVEQALLLCAKWRQQQRLLKQALQKPPAAKKTRTNLMRRVSDRPDPQDANESVYGPGTGDWNKGILKSDYDTMEREHRELAAQLSALAAQVKQQKFDAAREKIKELQARYGQLRNEAGRALLYGSLEAIGAHASIGTPIIAFGAVYLSVENFKDAVEKYRDSLEVNKELQSLLDTERHLEKDRERNGRER